MSWLSQGIDYLEKLASHLTSTNPTLAAQAQAATSAVQNASAPVETLAVAVVDTGVNAVLALIPGGAALDSTADAFIDEVIAQLFAKKSSSQPAPAPVALAAS